MKLALVIQRCAPDIYAGAEKLVWNLGKNFSEIFDVEILTTCAKDASNWKNHYKSGTEKIGNLKITRFPVDKERDPKYVHISNYLESNPDDIDKGLEFIDAMGPISNSLLKHIKTNRDKYDLFIFFGYLYWLTFHGMPLVQDKSLFFTQAHNEPWASFKIYDKIFDVPLGYLFQTNAEKNFVHKRFGNKDKPHAIVGHGIDLNIASKKYNSKIKIPKKYLLYIGRISAGKGCQLLSDYYNKYIALNKNDLKLIMIGDQEQKITNCNALIFENLKDQDKFFLLQNCEVFIMPSFYESLNMACLEAWLFQKPVLVNGQCQVLKEHCLDGNGGLYFENYHEFSETLTRILENKQLSTNLGINGEKYVRENYNWEQTRKNYSEFFSKILQKQVD